MLTKRIRNAIEYAAVSDSRSFGGGPGTTDISKNLESVKTKNYRYFYAAGVLISLVCILAMYFILKYQDNIAVLSAISSLGGLSLAGFISQMIRLGKEQNQADLIWHLASRLPVDDVRPVLQALLEQESTAPAESADNLI